MNTACIYIVQNNYHLYTHFFLVPDATERKLSTGAIVGIVLAAIVALLLITILAVVLVALFISK